MPLNKLENFIKNTEGRILYVNPNDLDATDSIENQGNSLTKPFKTIQRALLESARFSYLRGANNDIVEKTTILLFPGEHVVDNRPGFAIKNVNNVARTVSPAGTESIASETLSLTLTSNFDLNQDDNILYKFNSIYGGVVVPRGTSIVGLDLRKTKIRAKYVPNPTDLLVDSSAIFRITGACYFWQFSIFDADENGLVYTDPVDFSDNNKSRPTFSHHKLTCFEYADGVNIPESYDITDLDMYYSKLSNAFNQASGRNIDQKYPDQAAGFAKQRPEWEIVGAFLADPINISEIISGDGATPGSIITVTTTSEHNLTEGTPIKIKGVNVEDYNISTKVQNVTGPTTFTYLLPFVRPNLPAGGPAGLSGSAATVTIETDTVSGASPYIFNISLRSVWGMNGMHADGSKASGFRSMVVAQFTAVSLQKDDRSFVKYNKSNRVYDGISLTKQTGSTLSSRSSSTNIDTVYHLDSEAIYRKEWQPVHIKITNDAFIQIVSVFAIGFNKHFAVESGGDASITNSNSNFGQFSLFADGFKAGSFDKDDKAYITSIVTPRALTFEENNIDWLPFDVQKTINVGISSHVYLFGFNNVDAPPPVITQGYRIGARIDDKLYIDTPVGIKQADVYMLDNVITPSSNVSLGSNSAQKQYNANINPNSILNIGTNNILNGEKVLLISESGDLPENIVEHRIYYAVTNQRNSTRTDGISLFPDQIQLASSKTNAEAATPIPVTMFGGTQLKIVSRVSDKSPGETGHPIQFDSVNSAWYVHTNTNSEIYQTILSEGVLGLTERTNVSFVKRFEDSRSLDEKIYKFRAVIPKEITNSRDPSVGFIIQDSSSTGARTNADFNLTNITSQDFLFNRNPRFIGNATFDALTNIVTITTELPHNLKVGDEVTIINVASTTNPTATVDKGYNGKFIVTGIPNNKIFQYIPVDTRNIPHSVGTFTNNTSIRNVSLPRFEISNNKGNLFIYRNEVITPYIRNVQDGIYYLYVLNSSNKLTEEFTDLEYGQNIVDLYPQLDKDNINENPESSVTFAKRNPLGDVVTNDLRKSITRETVDKFHKTFSIVPTVSSFTSTPSTLTLSFNEDHGLSGIVTYTSLSGGSGYNNGTYFNVKLFNDISLSTWNGATARVVVSGGSVTSADIIHGGSAYSNNQTLYFDTSVIGGSAGASVNVTNPGITTAIGNVVQLTGIGTVTDAYYRISSIPSKNSISIARTTGDPLPSRGQYVINNGPSSRISNFSYNSSTGIALITTNTPHGLLSGNKFRILDSSNNNVGDFVVDERISPTQFNVVTNRSLSVTNGHILKHAISANDATADRTGENLGIRGLSFFDGETLTLIESGGITNQTTFSVRVPNAGIGTTRRFPLGSYIQIDNEIMRVISSGLTGSGNDKITVIRGSLGTISENHTEGSIIKKIKPLAIELRRPSIVRASGHTFEYLGYGPGNYSTGLPQVQVRTLSERENFLAQSQESSCGSVVYTGMNNDGDFYIGNTKYSATSGEQTTFDIPNPTVTGEDPSRLSVVFDEVIVKERLLVEGGNSNTVLSQFDGPVTFNKELKMNDFVIMNGALKVNNTVEITNTTESINTDTGALTVDGGVGIDKNLFVGGNQFTIGISSITNTTQSNSITTGALVVNGGVGIGRNVNIGQNLRVAGISTFVGNVDFNTTARFGDNDHLYFGDDDDLDIYHDGSDSYIDDRGTGILILRGNTEVRLDKFTGERMIRAIADSEVQLYFDNSIKLATKTNGIDVTGRVSATGDVIAFASDERLKTNIKPIDSALEKVMKLNGFTYNFNDIGEKLGFDATITHVGVSAQQVQSVLPEAVKPAPASDEYLTVQYEKLVPLLIESIKELKNEIEELKKSQK
jgi:hypothetical protein